MFGIPASSPFLLFDADVLIWSLRGKARLEPPS